MILPVQAYAAEARELTYIVEIEMISGRGEPFVLFDGNRLTTYHSGGGDVIRVTAPENIAQLYLVWGMPPGPWRVSAGDVETHGGQHGFIHEYIALDNPAEVIYIILPVQLFALHDIFLFGEGETPFWVEKWEPPLQSADLLLLPARSGDEFSFFGGALPYYAGERGLRVQVAYLEGHWYESFRIHEMLFGLWEMGVRNYPIIPIETHYTEEELADYLAGLLRRFKPQVAVSHGWGDELQTMGGRALLNAAQRSSDADFHPESAAEFGVWDLPKAYLHLYRGDQITIDWDIYLPSFGMTASQAAELGFSFHISRYALTEEPPGTTVFGLARTTVGADMIGGCFFENTAIRLEPLHTPEEEEIEEPPPPDDTEEEEPVSDYRMEIPRYIYIIAASFLVIAIALLLIIKKMR